MALSKTRGDPSRRSHPCVQLSDLGSNVGRDLDSAGTHADHRDPPSVKYGACIISRAMAQLALEIVQALDFGPFPVASFAVGESAIHWAR